MATTGVTLCKCGKAYTIYMPKSVLFGELLGDNSENWAAIDSQEESDGEIELSREIAREINSRFIDYRQTPVIICSCGELMDIKRNLAEHFKE